jgi:serpin B
VVFASSANPPTPAIAPAINALGLDLYREQIKSAKEASVLLSPYSIATALAMTYAGADGDTKAEMQRVLRFPADPIACSAAFQVLDHSLSEVIKRSEKWVADQKEEGGNAVPIQLSSANRLFIQKGFPLRKEFTDHAAQYFTAAPTELDFKHDPAGAREAINEWVADQTHNRIPEVLPVGQPTALTRLALVNALYLKASWADAFDEGMSKDEPFHLSRSQDARVPTMQARRHFGYAKSHGYSVVTVPYQTGSLQLVLFVPDKLDGLVALEKKLSAQELTACAQLETCDVILHLPRFKLEPATLPLGKTLQALGLKNAFDQPVRSANFARMAPRTADGYLYIGEVFHKTWLSLDEHGTEAAAATITLMSFAAGMPSKPPLPPVEVRVDRPFLFAIQHVDSGVCLFLGRVTDPR